MKLLFQFWIEQSHLCNIKEWRSRVLPHSVFQREDGRQFLFEWELNSRLQWISQVDLVMSHEEQLQLPFRGPYQCLGHQQWQTEQTCSASALLLVTEVKIDSFKAFLPAVNSAVARRALSNSWHVLALSILSK